MRPQCIYVNAIQNALALPSMSRGAMLRLASEDRRRQMDGSRGNENRNGPLSTVRVRAHVCACVLRFISPKEMTVDLILANGAPGRKRNAPKPSDAQHLNWSHCTKNVTQCVYEWVSEGVISSWKDIELHENATYSRQYMWPLRSLEYLPYLLRYIPLHTRMHKFVCRIRYI